MSNKPELKIKYISEEKTPSLEEMMAVGDELERTEKEEETPKHSSSSDGKENKRTLNYLYMPTWLWKWLVEASNAEGMKLERFVVSLIRESHRNWKAPEESSDAETYVFWARDKSDSHTSAYDAAYAIAVNYKNCPTEENMQWLIRSCERLGTDPEELIRRANTDAYAELIVQYRSDPDSKMNRAMNFVINFCRGKDEIPSRVLNEAGEQAGFTRQMLNTAKRKVGLKSILRAGEYYIVIPKSARVFHGKVTGE